MQGLLSEEIKIYSTDAATANGNGDAINGTGVDMWADGGWDGVLLGVRIETPHATHLVHAEQSANNVNFDDIKDSELGAAHATHKDQWIDVFRPIDRYVRLVVTRGAGQNTVLGPLYAVLYRGRKPPYAPLNTVRLVEPVEGAK